MTSVFMPTLIDVKFCTDRNYCRGRRNSAGHSSGCRRVVVPLPQLVCASQDRGPRSGIVVSGADAECSACSLELVRIKCLYNYYHVHEWLGWLSFYAAVHLFWVSINIEINSEELGESQNLATRHVRILIYIYSVEIGCLFTSVIFGFVRYMHCFCC